VKKRCFLECFLCTYSVYVVLIICDPFSWLFSTESNISPLHLFCESGIWTQGFLLSSVVLSHLTHTPSILLLVIFLIAFLLFAWTGLDHDPPIYASSVAGMAGTCHHNQLIDWDGVLLTFHLDLPVTMIFLISFWVAGIIGIYNYNLCWAFVSSDFPTHFTYSVTTH
jgi:hypothetical protein